MKEKILNRPKKGKKKDDLAYQGLIIDNEIDSSSE
tara:strand:+ start:472 stop:576 length:105 start_codon:yes stop_codon:yes gene_type:complete